MFFLFNIDNFLKHIKSNDGQVPKLVHRLDKGTTGCLIIARSTEAAQEFQLKFHSNSLIRKRYLAVVTPTLEQKAGIQDTIITGLVESQGR